MVKKIITIAKNIVNIIYPLHCSGCSRPLDPSDNSGVCEPCKAGIRQSPRPWCEVCGKPVHADKEICADCKNIKPHFKMARSACLYEGVLKELIHIFKYKSRISLSGILSGYMINFVKNNHEIIEGVDMITFVPLQNFRLKKRGFNQSGIFASYLAKELHMSVCGTLEKIKVTENQNELSRSDRLANLKGAFRVRRGAGIAGLKILLTDDVMTTGSTLDECAKMLIEAGAAEVRCLALARGTAS